MTMAAARRLGGDRSGGGGGEGLQNEWNGRRQQRVIPFVPIFKSS